MKPQYGYRAASIVLKYVPATNFKGSRLSISFPHMKKRKIVSWDDRYSDMVEIAVYAIFKDAEFAKNARYMSESLTYCSVSENETCVQFHGENAFETLKAFFGCK